MACDRVRMVEAHFAAAGQGDFAAVPEMWHPDVVYERHVPEGAATLDFGGPYRGIDGLRKAARAWFEAIDDVRLEAEEIIDAGDRVVALVRIRGTARASGLPFETEVGEVLTFSGDRVVRYDSYWERADALRAAGLDR